MPKPTTPIRRLPTHPLGDGIEYREAKPNPMFPDQLTALIRFAICDKAKPCAVCGKATRKHWTMLCPFHGMKVPEFSFGGLEPSPELAPLTLVCDEHPLAPTDQIGAAMFGGCPPTKPSKKKGD